MRAGGRDQGSFKTTIGEPVACDLPGVTLRWVDLARPIGDRDDASRVLCVDERARAERFFKDADRRRFVRTRCALRLALGEVLGIKAARVEIAYGPHGKPYLRDVPGLHFNVSHAADHALIGLGSHPIGVDIETDREIDELAVAEILFGQAEVAALARLRGQARRHAFLRWWVEHEALAKAVGTGLGEQLSPCVRQASQLRFVQPSEHVFAAVALWREA